MHPGLTITAEKIARMNLEQVYEIYALRYATVEREPGDVFLSRDPHDAPTRMDYFVWVIKGGGRNILVDTGFALPAAKARGRQLLIPVESMLTAMGVAPEAITEVVITHLHYDHAGNLDLFPNAEFHLHEREMSFATGRFMCHSPQNAAYDVEDICCMLHRVYAGRVKFHDHDVSIARGITLHRLGGHTDGLMAVRIMTKRGAVVLASDTMHYYANKERCDPFSIVFSVGDALEAFSRLRELAESEDHIIPGHDPRVCELYPRLGEMDVFALHLSPSAV